MLSCRAAVLVALLAAAAPALAGTVYSQAPLLGPNLVTPAQGARAAEATGDYFYQSTLADDFTLTANADIANISWTGYIEPYNLVTSSNISSFRIAFYAYDPTLPYFFDNTPLYLQEFAIADVQQTAVESPNIVGTTTYNFSLDLPTAVHLSANQTYFVAINANLYDSDDSSYFWAAGTRTTPDLYPNLNANLSYAPTNDGWVVSWKGQFADPSINYAGLPGFSDLAFSLSTADAVTPPVTGSAVPLPSAAIAIPAVLATGALRRNRR